MPADPEWLTNVRKILKKQQNCIFLFLFVPAAARCSLTTFIVYTLLPTPGMGCSQLHHSNAKQLEVNLWKFEQGKTQGGGMSG
jgi:hypothetical protein